MGGGFGLESLAGLKWNEWFFLPEYTVGLKPEVEKSNLLILDSFKEKLGPDLANRLNAFIQEKEYILAKISKRAESRHLFRQPTVLLAYLCANLSPAETKELWPLTPEELRPVFIDLGISFDNY